MNTDTGEIVTGADEIAKRIAKGEPIKEMLTSPKDYQMRRRPPSVGVNDPCPCGSGLKFKKCCYTGR